jgi:fatty acid desaturase
LANEFASPTPAPRLVIINTIINIRGMSQHTLLEHEQDPVRGSRTLLCGPVTRFFMCNENYHLEHHLYPGVPWYNLPKLHQALHQPLLEQGATYLPSYLAFVQEFAIASVARTSFGSIKIVD